MREETPRLQSEAAAFRFATFKSKPKTRARLLRIDLARSGKLQDLDLTLASAGGNNLARWLTALPPNTLDAAGYRRLLKQFAQRLKLQYTFYGETQLRRLGAGAFLGYYGDEEAESERMRGGMYRSGDLARWLPQVDTLPGPAGLRWSIDVDPLEID